MDRFRLKPNDRPDLRANAALATACVLLASATSANAGTFLVIVSGADAWTVVDPGAVVRDAKTRRLAAWTVTVQRNLTNSAPPQPGYIRTLNEYDCDEWRLRWRSFVAYSRFGAPVMKKDNPIADWTPPGGVEGEASLRVLCGAAGVGSVISAGSIGQLVISLMQAWDPPEDPRPAAVAAPPKPTAATPAAKAKGGTHPSAH